MQQVVTGLDLCQWRQEAIRSALAADISPNEVDWLLLELASVDRLSLRLESFKAQPRIALKVPLEELMRLWQQRIENRVPIQYLVGRTPWRDVELTVSPAVLIPRPETELLIDFAIALATPDSKTGHWADLGTGSGAIAIGLAKAFPEATVHAVDRSGDALAIAQTNAEYLGITNIEFYQGSWFDPLGSLKGKLSAMVSNPPYIPSQMVLGLQPEVMLHEPHAALDGGADGLDCIRELVAIAPDYLVSNGLWMIELMAGQGEPVAELLRQRGYQQIEIRDDFAGIGRFAIARKSIDQNFVDRRDL